MNRHNKQTLLSDLADIAARAHDANVTEATQRAIDYGMGRGEVDQPMLAVLHCDAQPCVRTKKPAETS